MGACVYRLSSLPDWLARRQVAASSLSSASPLFNITFLLPSAQGFAQELANEADSLGLDAQVIDLKTFTPAMLQEKAKHVFLLAVYGMG